MEGRTDEKAGMIQEESTLNISARKTENLAKEGKRLKINTFYIWFLVITLNLSGITLAMVASGVNQCASNLNDYFGWTTTTE